MIWFEKNILSIQEISAQTESLIVDSPYLLVILISTMFITIIFINYIFPILHIIKTHLAKETMKKNRKNMIKQIALQREIEEEIEKEL